MIVVIKDYVVKDMLIEINAFRWCVGCIYTKDVEQGLVVVQYLNFDVSPIRIACGELCCVFKVAREKYCDSACISAGRSPVCRVAPEFGPPVSLLFGATVCFLQAYYVVFKLSFQVVEYCTAFVLVAKSTNVEGDDV